jgi:hypothetical protein
MACLSLCAGGVMLARLEAGGGVGGATTTDGGGSGLLITTFTAQRGVGNQWHFTGQVNCAPLSEVLVKFGNMNELDNQSVWVDENGSFTFSTLIAAGESGIATAQAFDGTNVSNIAMALVTNY